MNKVTIVCAALALGMMHIPVTVGQETPGQTTPQRAAQTAHASTVNTLNVKYGALTEPIALPFTNAVAFTDRANRLFLVFRAETSTVDKVALILTVCNYNAYMTPRYSQVTKGKYTPIIYPQRDSDGGIYPTPLTGIRRKDTKEAIPLGAFWNVTTTNGVSREYWGSETNWYEVWGTRGSVTLTEVGTALGARVKGRLEMGDQSKGNVAIGDFDIPLIEQPKDDDWFDR